MSAVFDHEVVAHNAHNTKQFKNKWAGYDKRNSIFQLAENASFFFDIPKTKKMVVEAFWEIDHKLLEVNLKFNTNTCLFV